ncbi:hypothetical protein GDO81_006949 [Engystomops pustulosus]|uniref:Uncharacterized protein n=1 Tax=Engystomops pustulosus TaxID=76066 RepID=A0AAV7D2H3_ENGPU|nr:hypothetical protein GDO81_006949 [Engystomops pustulosus]
MSGHQWSSSCGGTTSISNILWVIVHCVAEGLKPVSWKLENYKSHHNLEVHAGCSPRSSLHQCPPPCDLQIPGNLPPQYVPPWIHR